MDVRIVVNGIAKEVKENTGKLFAALMTQNPGAQTPVKALKTLTKNPVAWAEGILAQGDSSDVIEVYDGESLVGKTTRGKIAKYVGVALSVGDWMPETFGKTEKVADNSEAEVI